MVNEVENAASSAINAVENVVENAVSTNMLSSDGDDTSSSSYQPKSEKLPDDFDYFAPPDPMLKMVVYSKPLPNPDFIFHNKLPKSGSSTMNQLLNQLKKKNPFSYVKLWPSDIPGDGFEKEGPFINHFKGVLTNVTLKPLVLLKHHFPFNFEPHGIRNPTYINVIRDPATWFQSHYYFERFGWQRAGGSRGGKDMNDEELNMTIDQCVQTQHKTCMYPVWKYVEFFCGNDPRCRDRGRTEEAKRVAVEMAKKRVVDEFYVIGVLEQFEDTLALFDKMLPSIYADAPAVYATPCKY